MPKFGRRSQIERATLHPKLRDICDQAIKYMDFAIIQGHREEADQEKAFKEGKSKARWPHSEHNKIPSRAMDLFPAPYDWKDIESFRVLADLILGIAERRGVKLRWGGTFKTLRDFPHFELT